MTTVAEAIQTALEADSALRAELVRLFGRREVNIRRHDAGCEGWSDLAVGLLASKAAADRAMRDAIACRNAQIG